MAPNASRSVRPVVALGLTLALILAGSPAGAQGRGIPDPRAAAEAVAATGAVLQSVHATTTSLVRDDRGLDVRRAVGYRPAAAATSARTTDLAPARPVAWVKRASVEQPAPRPKTVSTAKSGSTGSSRSTSSSSYRGRNHVWIPALGIDRSVSGFACSSSAYPGNRVYRWGCAGRNNVDLFGHAHSVFKPLHDAYVRHRLKKGMKVVYADSRGKVSTYAVAWWKVVKPDNGAFAYAAQSRPSMTLQTCVGSKSQYRLIVRLTKV